MARSCIFCGGTNLTGEHIWPKWAAKKVAGAGAAEHRLFRHERGSEVMQVEYSQLPYEQIARVACAECNNRWMSDLEKAAQPYFETMLAGNGRAIHKLAQRTLAAWALKTTMVFVASQAKDGSAIPAKEYVYLRKTGEPSNDVNVLMLSYDGSHPAICDSYGIELGSTDDQAGKTAWGANLTFGGVAFHLFGSDMPRLLAPADIRVPWIHEIWPLSKPFTWTAQPCCNSPELEAMIDGSLRQYQRLTGMELEIR